MRRLGLLVTSLGGAAALAQPVTVPALSDAERRQLDGGGVVLHEVKPTDDRGVAADSFGVVDATPDEVWPAVRDCEHFSRFLPNTKKSWRRTDGDAVVCFDELELPFPLTNLWAETRSVMRQEPARHYAREWSFLKGTYRRNRGSWRVVPWDAEGKRALVVYSVDSDPTMLVPDVILRAAQTGSVPKLFEGLRRRVRELRAAPVVGATP